jgi:hypothetical protein
MQIEQRTQTFFIRGVVVLKAHDSLAARDGMLFSIVVKNAET